MRPLTVREMLDIIDGSGRATRGRCSGTCTAPTRSSPPSSRTN